MEKIAIITARGGSKRIPRKNIKEFLGKPIIAYSIQAALASNLFDEVMVSTDDDEIKSIAEFYGAKVPFFRSSKTSDDFATTFSVLQEVITEYAKRGDEIENGCCIYPTAPFITSKILEESYNVLSTNSFDSVFSIIKYSFPIQRALRLTSNRVEFIWPENKNKRSQDLLPSYHDAGQFYWFNSEKILSANSLITINTGFYELKETEVQDIDSLEDWKLAEYKFQLLNSK